MVKNTSSKSRQTATTGTSKSIKNTFAPGCLNEYFTPATLFSLCKYGYPYEDLPEEAKKMLDEFIVEYDKKCDRNKGNVHVPMPPDTAIVG